MRAFVLPDFDQAPEVQELPVPEPGECEVRVKVHAASVNGFDLAVAGGYLKGGMEHRFPVVLGKDFAGVVDAVGPGVDGYAVGDRVFGVVTKPYLGDGSFAERVTVPVAVGLAPIPEGVSFPEAAALGLAGTAAFDSVAAAGITPGGVVLVAGATGGVGNQAVQLAAAAGAQVIATAHTDAEREHVTGLGAAGIVDFTADIPAQIHATHPEGVDVVLHFAGDPVSLATVLKPGGRLVSTIAQSAEQAGVPQESFTGVYAVPTPQTLGRLAENQATGLTRVRVEESYDLAGVAVAFGHFGRGTLGKLVVVIAEEETA